MFQYYLGFFCGMSYWNTFFKTNFTGVSLGAEKKRPPKVFRRRACPSIQFCQRGGGVLAGFQAGWLDPPPWAGRFAIFLSKPLLWMSCVTPKTLERDQTGPKGGKLEIRHRCTSGPYILSRRVAIGAELSRRSS